LILSIDLLIKVKKRLRSFSDAAVIINCSGNDKFEKYLKLCACSFNLWYPRHWHLILNREVKKKNYWKF